MRFLSLEKHHINQVLEIADTSLGKGYLTSPYLNKFIDSKKYLGFVIVEDQNVVGFTSLVLLTTKELKQTVLKEHDWFYETIKKYETIGLRQQTIVHTAHVKKGYGYQLFDFSSNAILSLCDVQISTAWSKGSEKSMQSLLLKCGFNYAKTIENYWLDDSIIKNYNCAVCGVPPCKCATEVYIKKNAPDKI